MENEEKLIEFLAQHFRNFIYYDWTLDDSRGLYKIDESWYRNPIVDNYCFEKRELKNFEFQITDGFNRIVNPYLYIEKARKLREFQEKSLKKGKHYKIRPNRGVAISFLRKYSKKVSTKKIKHIVAMQKNPEMKEFNRNEWGTAYCYDSWYRVRKEDRSWKTQSKRRHQWKEEQ